MTPWETIPIERRQTAEHILTPKQLTVLKHRINKHSWNHIAIITNTTPPTARGHYRAALKRLEHHWTKERDLHHRKQAT